MTRLRPNCLFRSNSFNRNINKKKVINEILNNSYLQNWTFPLSSSSYVCKQGSFFLKIYYVFKTIEEVLPLT